MQSIQTQSNSPQTIRKSDLKEKKDGEAKMVPKI